MANKTLDVKPDKNSKEYVQKKVNEAERYIEKEPEIFEVIPYTPANYKMEGQLPDRVRSVINSVYSSLRADLLNDFSPQNIGKKILESFLGGFGRRFKKIVAV